MVPARLSALVSLTFALAAAAETVSAPAAATTTPSTAGKVEATAPDSTPAPWRGSAVSYGHWMTATTLVKSAEPYWNPTYVHHLDLAPEWHVGEHLVFRGAFSISQELTLSDNTSYVREFELSDLSLSGGVTGFKEPTTGIGISGDLKVTLPTSKVSLAQTRVMAVGPGVTLSRKFDVLSGLTISYSGRFTYRFNRFTTGELESPRIASCGDPRGEACATLIGGTSRNVNFDLFHGPRVTFSPHPIVSIYTAFNLSHQWLYPFSNVAGISVPTTDTTVRNFNRFELGVSVQVLKPLALSLTGDTFGAQTGTNGLYQQPFFNRFTTISLDAAIDIEALVASL